MTLDELERANELSREIRRLHRRAEEWRNPKLTLVDLVRSDDVDIADEADVVVFRTATVEKLIARLSELEAEFAALPLTMEFTVTYANGSNRRPKPPRQIP